MAVLPIVYWPHPTLSKPTREVTEFDETLHRFLDDMAETMYAAEGVGLAANQVDDLRRVTVIDTAGQDEPSQLLELINPRVVDKEGTITWQEGCLSFPELYFDVKRADHVKVEYQDRNGETQTIEADELLAVALQHEIDHLDGVVFIDRIGMLDRRLMLRKYNKIMTRRKREGID